MNTRWNPGRDRPGAVAPGPWHAAPAEADDGWIGTRELPGYRAGAVVVRLSDLPGVDAAHLYFDLLLLDESGRTEETHSGPCPCLRRDQPLDQRSRFVRVVAELLRHAPDPERGLAGLGAALTFIRENGVEGPQLAAAAQRIDAGSSEAALVASLCHVLTLSFGEQDAGASLGPVLSQVAPGVSTSGELEEQVRLLVRCVGKAQARRRLREATDFELLPSPDLLGV
jgi:hypothetical protein